MTNAVSDNLDFRLKRLAAKLERDMPQDNREVVPSVHVALLAARRKVIGNNIGKTAAIGLLAWWLITSAYPGHGHRPQVSGPFDTEARCQKLRDHLIKWALKYRWTRPHTDEMFQCVEDA